MSDKFNKDESTQSFKDQILRDLEALKAKIQADDASREAEIAQEEASLLEATEASIQKKFSQDLPSEESVETDEGPLASEVLDESLEAGADSSDTQGEEAEPVPDFVAAQAKRFADMRAQIDAKLSEIDPEPPVATIPDDSAELDQTDFPKTKVPLADEADEIEVDEQGELKRKLAVTFNPEQVVLPEEELAGSVDDDVKEKAPVTEDIPVGSETAFVTAPLVSDDEDLDDNPVRSRRSQSQVSKQKTGSGKRFVAWLLAIAALLILVVGFAGYFYINDNLKAVDTKSTANVQVEIPDGASAKEIGDLLEKSDLIKNATVFNYYVKFKGYDNFQSGFHNFQKSMTVDKVIAELQKKGTEVAEPTGTGKITIPEGYTLSQIAEAVTLNAATSDENDKSHFTKEDFMTTVQDEAFIAEMVAKYPNLLSSLPAADSGVKYRLEGYLFPATYSYEKSTTSRELIDQMLAAADSALTPYYEQITARGNTVNEILTLASLVEKEGATDEDRRNIASTFYNRIQSGMPLQSNIAILYAEDKLGQKTTLSEDIAINTEIDSPYNNYVHLGYMPGPVDSPSLSAIEATVNPSETTYLYFVADVTTGKVYFANTYEEHSANVQTYVNDKVASTEASSVTE